MIVAINLTQKKGYKEVRCFTRYQSMVLKNKNDVWKQIEDKKPANIGKKAWRQCYEGVKAVIESLGLKMVTSGEEFDKLEVPSEKKKDGHVGKQYMYRKIVISKDGRKSQPTRISDILRGNSSFLTEAEKLAADVQRCLAVTAKQRKGISVNCLSEMKSSADLDAMIGVDTVLHRVPLFEFRLSDVAYCFLGDPLDDNVFVADQIKSSKVDKDGCLHFKHAGDRIKVSRMVKILETGSTLTCIGKNIDDIPDVVWFFNGAEAIDTLRKFPEERTFHPRLHLKCISPCAFTAAMNNAQFRFDIGMSDDEKNRLLQRKVQAVKYGKKHSLEYLNEHESQIQGQSHRVEHQSFQMIRDACKRCDTTIGRESEDAYSQVDFRLDKTVRIQDKVGKVFQKVGIRYPGRHPYNPDNIDVLQITDLQNKVCYILPMRIANGDKVVSQFSEEDLMRNAIHISNKWLRTLPRFDLNDDNDVRRYIEMCHEAHSVPPLTDQNFYSDILQRNASKFGPPHKFYNKGAKKAAQVLT